jgi:hypothetical protein
MSSLVGSTVWCTQCNGHISLRYNSARTFREVRHMSHAWLDHNGMNILEKKRGHGNMSSSREREREDRIHGAMAKHLWRSKQGQILTAVLSWMPLSAPFRLSLAPMPGLPRASWLRRLALLLRELFLVAILHLLVFLRTCRPKRPVRHD